MPDQTKPSPEHHQDFLDKPFETTELLLPACVLLLRQDRAA
jgi:hypothetical protein